VVAIVYLWRYRRQSRGIDEQWRPRELRGAKIIYAETQFRIADPFPLVARVDRGFRVGQHIVLVELKTRLHDRVYASDVIELSAQKLAIERQTAEPVSDIGFVVTQDPQSGQRRTYPVRLVNESQLVSLFRRRQGILAGEVQPCRTGKRGICWHCAFVERCVPESKG
jgi:CRISPR/Cas system-associated exonuclease Cas4 (RecB family)